jgi:hypothetical protein
MPPSFSGIVLDGPVWSPCWQSRGMGSSRDRKKILSKLTAATSLSSALPTTMDALGQWPAPLWVGSGGSPLPVLCSHHLVAQENIWIAGWSGLVFAFLRSPSHHRQGGTKRKLHFFAFFLIFAFWKICTFWGGFRGPYCFGHLLALEEQWRKVHLYSQMFVQFYAHFPPFTDWPSMPKWSQNSGLPVARFSISKSIANPLGQTPAYQRRYGAISVGENFPCFSGAVFLMPAGAAQLPVAAWIVRLSVGDVISAWGCKVVPSSVLLPGGTLPAPDDHFPAAGHSPAGVPSLGCSAQWTWHWGA